MNNYPKEFLKMLRDDLSNIVNDIVFEQNVAGALLISVFAGTWLYSFTMSAAFRSFYMDSVMPFISFGLLIVATCMAYGLEDSPRISYTRIMLLASSILLTIFIAISQ